MLIRAMLSILTLALSQSLQASEKQTVKLAVYLPQSPPYMFINPNTGNVTGILPDIFQLYSEKNNLTFEYKYLNRVRAELELYSGESDVSLLSPAWVKHPKQLLYSEPLFQTKDRFYSLSPINNSIDFNGQVVCTRQFYQYPVFDQMVKDKKVIRMDTESETVQLKMLLSHRCDMAYINEWVADYMKKNLYSFVKIHSSELSFDQSNGILAFNPKWKNEIDSFNRFIKTIKQSGHLNEIIERYTK